MKIRVAIDTGGTFTDVVAINEETGNTVAIKTPSTPKDPSQGLLNGIDKIFSKTNDNLNDMNMLLHGSTVATNAVLEHKFSGLGLLVTNGFRDMIEIARQSVPDGYGNSFFWVKPPRLVPLHLVREIKGRLRFDGSEIEPIDPDFALNSISELVNEGVNCIGVCLLHSYANSKHEKFIGELIKKHFPNIFFSLSSVVLPEYREYERAMTTLIDVLVKPYCETYLGNAAKKLYYDGIKFPFLIMQSNGGVVRHSTASEKPVTMLLSGPAAGVLGAVHMSKLAGFDKILTSDVGGTSTDISIVENQVPLYTSETMVENYPVKTPMLDIVTVGSGGGSIAWTDDYGNMKVGPQSAGADPGPVCYSKGGDKPTVTDAAVVLGRLPKSLIGGELELNEEKAKEIYKVFGNEHGMKPEEAAAGVLELAAINQVFGIRKVTTTRGRDPSNYAMVAFGGAGGLFATEVAEFLEITTIITPPDPGNLCALGLHVSDVKRDYIQTIVRSQSNYDQEEIIKIWTKLRDQGIKDIIEEGILRKNINIEYVADIRYFGEGHEVQVNIPQGLTIDKAINFMWQQFHQEHDKSFGFHYEGKQDVELVNLRVRAVGIQNRPKIKTVKRQQKDTKPKFSRDVFWKDFGWISSSVFDRNDLAIGQIIKGPAIVEEYGSTTVVPKNWSCIVDEYKNIILKKAL
jgi:N-methylhydantoinase A